MRFDPGSDFDVLRSGEHAVVEVPFTLIGTRDDEAEATARIIVHGFHADDDVATTWGRESVAIDLFANDHLPQLRQQISLGHMVPPARGSVSFSNGVATFTPSADHAQLKSGESDTITFSYGIVGPMGATDTASVTVTVQGFSAEPDTATTWQDVPVDIDVLANDHGGQRAGLTLVSVTQPSKGSVSIVGDRLRFDPGSAFSGISPGTEEVVQFSYVVRSPDGATTATATVSLTVRAYTYSFSYGAWSSCSGATWNPWGTWSACSTSCGGGTQVRYRTCNTSGSQTRSVLSCVRSDGASADHSLCGTPTLTQTCTASCSGSGMESTSCNTQACSPEIPRSDPIPVGEAGVPTEACFAHVSGAMVGPSNLNGWFSVVGRTNTFSNLVGMGSYANSAPTHWPRGFSSTHDFSRIHEWVDVRTFPFGRATQYTFDGIAIGPRTRMIIYSQPSFGGSIVADLRGPMLVNNSLWRVNWYADTQDSPFWWWYYATYFYGVSVDFWKSAWLPGNFHSLIPPHRRFWSHEVRSGYNNDPWGNMHPWGRGTSVRVICD